MNQNDIHKCPECKLDMIYEEIIFHKCSKPTMDFWVLDDKFLIWDGFRYIPIKRNSDQPSFYSQDGQPQNGQNQNEY